MTVCVYSRDYLPWPGGLSTYTRYQAESLLRRGLAVTVVTETPADGPEPPWPGRVVRTPTWGARARVVRDSDVLHLNTFRWSMLLLAKWYRKPVVLTHHTHRRVCPLQTAWHAERMCRADLADCARALFRRVSVRAGIVKLAAHLLKRGADRWIDASVVPSAYARERLFLNGFARVRLIESGVPAGPAGVTPSRRAGARLTALFVGHLIPEKGYPVLFEAIRRCLQGGSDMRLIVCGDGDHDELEVAKRDSHAAGLDGAVEFTGYVELPQVQELMRRADVVVVPSVAPEIAPLVILEAMHMGCVVVGADCGGIPELIGETGMVFAWNDAADLSRRLARLAQDPVLRQELADRALRRARARYTLEQMGAGYHQLFTELCGRHS